MGWLEPRQDPLHLAYHAELSGEKLGAAFRNASLFVIALNTSFIALDLWTHPEQIAELLAIRMAWNVAMVGAYWLSSRIEPIVATRIGCLVTGVSLIAVSGAVGGVTSVYWPAIMVLFLGMPVFLPMTARESGGIVSILWAVFASLPLFTAERPAFEAYIVPVFFVMAAAVESVASCALLDRMRFADFQRRLEVESARDELQRMDEQKSRFTANVHHELRTPLTLMLAPLEAMLGGEFGAVSELQRGYLDTMRTNSLRLLKLINNLLDLAKAEGQQMTIRRRPIAIAQIFDEVASSARPLAERKGIALEMAGAEDAPTVHADADALEKVAVNLVGNALKFTEAGGTIRLEARGEADGVLVSVSDTGAGIPADQLERIFDRFAQADGSATRRYEGTGIGLALVKELVDLHDGRIWAESDGVGCGATLHLFLPHGEPDPVDEEEVLQTPEGQAVSLNRSLEGMLDPDPDGGDEAASLLLVDMERNIERDESVRKVDGDVTIPLTAPADAPEVLIAEDNPDMRRLMGFLLGREFRIRIARNGREALDSVRALAPDLVLTDVMMPEMSGTELCRELKGNPATAGIPVVLVTSKAEREMKIEGLELGADDYVAKPFHPRELLARVRSLVRLHSLQEELAERNLALEKANRGLGRALDELKETEVQLVQAERLSAVGELAAGVAHEINNPVNFASNAVAALQTHVDDLRRVAALVAELDWKDRDKLAAQLEEFERLRDQLGIDELEESLGELAGIVAEGLDRTRRLVGDLRDFAGPGRPTHTDVDLGRGIRSTVELLGHETRRSGVDVTVEVPPGLARVSGDPRALNQILLNLLKNAIEALEGRGGAVSVVARQDAGEVVVAVSDDGPGIDPAIRESLFEPFCSTKKAGHGSGLGLSISRRIALEHDGSLDARPGASGGTTFELRLPTPPEAPPAGA